MTGGAPRTCRRRAIGDAFLVLLRTESLLLTAATAAPSSVRRTNRPRRCSPSHVGKHPTRTSRAFELDTATGAALFLSRAGTHGCSQEQRREAIRVCKG